VAFNIDRLDSRHAAGYVKLTQMPRLDIVYRAFVMKSLDGVRLPSMTQDLRLLRGRKQSETARCIEKAAAVYCFAMVMPDPAPPAGATAAQMYHGGIAQVNKAEHTVHGMVLYYPNNGGRDTRPKKISGPQHVILSNGKTIAGGTPARSGRAVPTSARQSSSSSSSSSSGARGGTRSSSSSSSSSRHASARDEEVDDEEDERDEEPDCEEVDTTQDLDIRNVDMLWESRCVPSSPFCLVRCSHSHRTRKQIRPEDLSQAAAFLPRCEISCHLR